MAKFWDMCHILWQSKLSAEWKDSIQYSRIEHTSQFHWQHFSPNDPETSQQKSRSPTQHFPTVSLSCCFLLFLFDSKKGRNINKIDTEWYNHATHSSKTYHIILLCHTKKGMWQKRVEVFESQKETIQTGHTNTQINKKKVPFIGSFSHDKSINRLSRNWSSGRGNFRPQAAKWLWHSLSQVRCDFETIP